MFYCNCNLTCLTMKAWITRCTVTQVAVDVICTGTTVLTGCTDTLGYIYGERNKTASRPPHRQCLLHLTLFALLVRLMQSQFTGLHRTTFILSLGKKKLRVLAESRPVWSAGLLRIHSNCTYIVTGSGRRNQDTFTKISKRYPAERTRRSPALFSLFVLFLYCCEELHI